jgi:hypothetical protein
MYKLLPIMAFVVLLSGLVFSEQLFCNNQNLSYTNNKIVCFYTPDKEEYLAPSAEGTISISKVEYKSTAITPNSSWVFKLYTDIDSTKEGMQELVVKQADFKQKFNVFVSKNDIISATKTITYEENIGLIVLELTNNSKNKLDLTLKYNFPDSYETSKESESLTLLGKSKVSLKIPFEYSDPDYKKGEIVILYNLENQQKVKKELVEFDPYLVPYQEDSKLTPYFLLTNNKVMLGLDIVLLLIAIVLFTMFIGRLGKKIVKE